MAMGKCAAKGGFFILRDCRNLALNTCHFCMRPSCGDHYLMRGAMVVCLDCNARQQQQTEEERADLLASDGAQNRSGLHSYRHGYYHDSSANPFYLGYYYDRYYDTYDTRAFDKRQVDAFFGDDTEAGFLDS